MATAAKVYWTRCNSFVAWKRVSDNAPSLIPCESFSSVEHAQNRGNVKASLHPWIGRQRGYLHRIMCTTLSTFSKGKKKHIQTHTRVCLKSPRMSSSKRHFGKRNEALFSAVGSLSSRQVPLQFRWCANSSKFPLACHAIGYHYESTFFWWWNPGVAVACHCL